jgi:hypothetical protein
MMQPVVLGALVMLVINDHWAKAAFDNYITGKISDFAGLLFFPVLLTGLGERFFKRLFLSRGLVWGTAIATAVVFTLVKSWEPMGDLYRWGLGFVQWPFYALQGDGGIQPVKMMADRSDLMALPMCGVAVWLGLRRIEKNQVVTGSSSRSG